MSDKSEPEVKVKEYFARAQMKKLISLMKVIIFCGILSGSIYGITVALLPKIPDFYKVKHWDVVFLERVKVIARLIRKYLMNII